jgi:hypothetical protein
LNIQATISTKLRLLESDCEAQEHAVRVPVVDKATISVINAQTTITKEGRISLFEFFPTPV